MVICEFIGACPFRNGTMTDMPLITQKLEGLFCDGDFTMCLIYKFAMAHGIDKVPEYVSPYDTYELSSWYCEHVLNR